MNAAVVKKTQDTLGKVIKKPPLTEKLLCKPPFRYLHDIFSEVIRTTGFMKGLYGENEMKSDNVKDKDSKIIFLQKAIDVVMLVSGEPLAAKPARIVAGHEPEKTNELLQAMAKCCLNKISSDDAVKRVLAGEKVDMKSKASTSRSQDKENREGRERHLDREEKKKITERSRSQDQKDPDQPKDQESRRRDGEKELHRDRERSDKHHRSEQDHHAKDHDKDKSRERDKEKDKGRVKDRDKEKNRERDREREKDKERDKEREKTRDRDSHRDRERDKDKRRDRDKEREKERERHKQGDERNKSGESGNSKVQVSEEPQQKPTPEEHSKTAKPVPAPAEAVENQSDSPARIPRPSSAKGQRRRPKIGGQDESDSEGDGDAQSAQRPALQENGDTAGSAVPSNMASSNRRIPRPSSARPAPPRVKRQESYTDVTPAERLSSVKPSAPVIMDGKRLSDDEEDDDEQFVVEEAVPPTSDAHEMEVEPAQQLDSEDKHGGLVKKILETKKDYELSPSSPKSKEQNVVSEAARKKERDVVTREIERLRSSIQTVCRSTLPLGKIMDYIQEDMDAMQAELHTWRRENKEHAQALLQEQRETDKAVEPLKAELAELEQLIKDQQDKICAVRSNILKNEEKIQKMVTGINFSSRT
ncbi:TRAF3-interacting protein 1 isoform X2 [Siniperca chuatsi]|uniref:TRAF3-interacting protein 1 isoform X2 n=1 Tax=Siniperca chuatsi TaxID=119488 RepID=UPI001CE136AE|nr:TRAF3-interacting protein 1 isoform X2 [Siniperca chuatsi]